MAGKRIGWIQILLGLILLGLVIRYWYVAVPLVIAVVAFVVWRDQRARAAVRCEAARAEAERIQAERVAEAGRIERQARRYASLEAASRGRTNVRPVAVAPVAVMASEHESPSPVSTGTRPAEDGTSAYEFDVALSFAGEDRDIAHVLAAALRAREVRVFYDEFLTAEMWGEDLVVYFDEVFRRKTRYVVAFVSRYYVSKPWTNLERRSVQARFLSESNPSLLPVRLDDSELPGMPPTISYVDLRATTIEAVVDLILEKLGSARADRRLARIERVPRTVHEEAFLLATRPPAWEYLLLAAVLLRERDALDSKWRDYVLGYVQPQGASLDDQEATALLSSAFRHAETIGENVERILSPQAVELAVGRPGEAGDPVQIEHLAQRLIDCYDEFLDWSARLRGAPFPGRFDRAFELASSFADEPIEQIRAFVDRTVAELDRLPARLREGSDEPLELKLTLTLSITEGLVDEYDQEMRKLSR